MYIENILKSLIKFDDNTQVRVSDGSYILNEFGSDRGDYYDMYIGYTEEVNENTISNVKELKELFERALKQGVMIGYKGGEFDIHNYTCVTIGCYGCSGSYISDVKENDGVVYLVYETMQEVWFDN